MNVLVTGSNGQLGTELRRLALDSPHHFIFTDINSLPGVETVYLDISDRASIDIIAESEKVDIIVNCAAYTDVERAESEIDMAMLLNHQAVLINLQIDKRLRPDKGKAAKFLMGIHGLQQKAL